MPDAPPIDPDAFRAFEHAGWERAAAHYRRSFGDLTGQATLPLLDAVGAGPGMRLLDVACGPGALSAAAAVRGARPTGVDFASAMVAEARALHPGLEFREGDAEALPFADSSFDAVAMAFGLLHLARPERAMAEARRVLRAGGRFAFTVWCPPEECAGFALVLRAIEAHGNPNIPVPAGPPFFRFADAEECRRSFIEAGFHPPSVARLPLVWRLDRPEGLFAAMTQGGVRTAAILRGQTPEALDAIARALLEGVDAFERDGGYELPMPAVLASAMA